MVDSYTISYSFTITGCSGLVGAVGGDTVTGIGSSNRTHSLINLQENTEYIISISAVNGAGTSAMSPMTTTNTPTTGNYVHIEDQASMTSKRTHSEEITVHMYIIITEKPFTSK